MQPTRRHLVLNVFNNYFNDATANAIAPIGMKRIVSATELPVIGTILLMKYIICFI